MAKITFNEYMELSARTAASHENEIINYAMGLAGETGELIDLVKKFLFHKHRVDKDKVKKEGGDVLWYSGQLVRLLKIVFRNDDVFKTCADKVEEMKKLPKETTETLLMIACLNLSKASGIISGIVDKNIDGKKYVKDELYVAMSTVLISLCFIITVAGLTMEEVAEGNIEKLKRRYPEGFSSERSINRTED